MPRPLLAPLCLLVASALAAQTTGIPPDPATAPHTAAQPGPQGTPASSSRVPTLTTGTNLVVVDVVVTDRNGHNVHGLKQTDFAVSEDNRPEPLRSFDEHTAPTDPPRPEPPLDLPPGVFTNYAPVPHTAALNVLLFDTLNTPFLDQSFLRSQLLEYIRSASPSDRMAIFGLTTHLIYLQGFTTDPALLRAAIDKKSMRQSQLLSNPTSGLDGTKLSENIASAGDPHLAAAVERVRELEAKEESFQVQLRAHYTLDAMNALARYLASLPGRKNLIWFSGSFPLSVLPNNTLADPFAAAADLGEELRDTTTLLTGAQVAIYPVDARGLFNSSIYDPSRPGSIDPLEMNRDFSQDSQRRMEEFSTMRSMAEQTGGRAFVNNNGLKEALVTILRTGANFYTLTYSPSNNPQPDGHFRHISVHLLGLASQQSLTLSYRRGYFALPDAASGPPRKALVSNGRTLPAAPGNPNVLRSAMLRGAPDTTGIIFKAQVLPEQPASAPPEPSPDPETHVNSNPKLAHGPWRRYSVDLSTAPGQLMVRRPDGSYTGIAEFVVHCFSTDGALLSSVAQTASMKLSAEDVRRAAGSGIVVHETISVPDRAPSHQDLFLRIGVHSLLDNRVGSLELPLAAIKNLPPAPSPPAPAQAALPSSR